MARKSSLGVFRNGEDEVVFEGVTVPGRLLVQALGLGGDPDMFAEFEINNGKAECSRIEWRRSRDGRAVVGSDVHEIADLNTYVNDAFLRYSRVLAEFRANEGKVGGQFAGAPLVLIHHRDRNSGKEYVAPVFYMRAEEPETIYVFATLGGGMRHPNWYLNLLAARTATVELGNETYDVAVKEIVGAQRDSIYAEQTRRYPVFGEYERLNAGVRTIPVHALRRAGI
jgi:deazaflavin-dependent oxidoreductase (nitroreductase family)